MVKEIFLLNLNIVLLSYVIIFILTHKDNFYEDNLRLFSIVRGICNHPKLYQNYL